MGRKLSTEATRQFNHSADVRKKIGEFIQRRRKDLDITAEKLGNMVGLSKASVSNIERGQQALSVETFWAIAVFLKCYPSDLMPHIPAEKILPAATLRNIQSQTDDNTAKQWVEELFTKTQYDTPGT